MSKLDDAVSEIVASAMSTFTISDSNDDVRVATKALVGLLKDWGARDRVVRDTVNGLLRMIRAKCKHEGAVTGWNERDGSWMSPCPTCGGSK